MAILDLRNASIFLRDGSSIAVHGAINDVANYAIGDSVLTVDGFVGALANGQSLIIGDTLTVYTITSHTESTGNTTSITVTPVLVAAVNNNDVITLVGAVNHGGGYPIGTSTIVVDGFVDIVEVGEGFTIGGTAQVYSIVDHSETASKTTSITFSPPLSSSISNNDSILRIGNVIEIKIGEGTLTYAEKRGVIYMLNRGRIFTVKLGDDSPMDVSFNIIWEFLRAGSGDPPTPEEALKNIGAASDWISTSTDPCEPFSLDIMICHVPPCVGESEVITLPAFRWEDLSHDAKNGTISTTGKCNHAFADVVHYG